MKILIHNVLVIPIQCAEVDVDETGHFTIVKLNVGALATNQFIMEQIDARKGEVTRPDLHDEISACVTAEVLDMLSEKADAAAAVLSPAFAEANFNKRASDPYEDRLSNEELARELESLEEEHEDVAEAAANLKKVIN